jgi:hypothetical protein
MSADVASKAKMRPCPLRVFLREWRMKSYRPVLICLAQFLWFDGAKAAPVDYFGVHVVDDVTGRGVPLIELRTVNDLRFVTDSAGWVAFNEPGLMNREVWFSISGPGYEKAKDGFGFRGVRFMTNPVEKATVKLNRTNIAERIGRTTGQGIYRDSELLGLPCAVPNLMAEVMGQDSVQAVPYRGKIFWLWGDTNVPHYPLGNYQTTAATTALNAKAEQGIRFDYFMDSGKPERIRRMMPLKEHGAVWLFGLLTVKDGHGEDAMLAHYGRHEGLSPPLQHGVCRFNEEHGVFESVLELDKEEKWRFPQGNALRVTDGDGDFFYFAHPFCHTRVKAALHDLTTPENYEALWFDEGAKVWRWQKQHAPTTQAEEMKLLIKGSMKHEQAHFQVKDAATDKPVRFHNTSITWNEFRKKFVLIGLQSGDKGDASALGEVWYAEAASAAGPWHKAVKVASHSRYSFYNPVHHDFLDAEGGRVIYFQGTYSLEFSGNPLAPARYDYNQLMYRLDLSDDRLRSAH